MTVTLATQNAAQNTGGAGSDTLIGIENLTGGSGNDTLTGSSSNNVINGGSGNDTINGGGGHDRIIGGAGRDILTGGTGNDTFVIDVAASGLAAADLITDFASGDQLDIGRGGTVWFNNNSNQAAATHASNDSNVNDLVIYGNAAGTEILAVILDYTTDPVDGIFTDTISTFTEI